MWAQSQISSLDHESFLRDARDYALLNGLVVRNKTLQNDNCVTHIPFTLFPSPIPKRLYEECLELQTSVNSLMCKIANDQAFIEETLRPIVQVDKFTSNLLDVNKAVLREGLAQPIISCISRADYMLDKQLDGSLDIKQVEVNTIASSMSSHSRKLKACHEFLFSKYGVDLPQQIEASLPENEALDLVAQAIIDAFDSYKQSCAYVLLIDGEKVSINFSDHHHIEQQVHKSRPDVRFIRKKFGNLPLVARLGPNRELIIDDSKEIAIVYFRYGYDPSNYNFENAWDVRLLLERSRAIKCPSINFHLSGAKKFQQVLNTSQQLEKYLDNSNAQRLAKLFCKFWALDTSNPDTNELILNSSGRLVLKPQREGGGHNVFGNQIRPFLDTIKSSTDLAQYILMEYIDSPHEFNWLLLQGDTNDIDRLGSPDRLVSELGIFGSILADGSREFSNKSAGYLVRSKRVGVNEGGVMAGYGGISNILLLGDEYKSHYKLFYDK